MRHIDDSFRALADRTRRSILRMLRDGSMNAGQLAERLDMAANALSFHLRVLKSAGLIGDQRCGQFIRYSLDVRAVDDLLGVFMEQIGGKRSRTRTSPTEPAKAADGTGQDVSYDVVPAEQDETADDVTLL